MPAPLGPPGADLAALTSLWRERGVSIAALADRGSQSLEASDRALTSGLTEAAGRVQLEPLTEARLAHEPFEIGELLGRGGMGTVHRAVQRSLRREVAIKRVAEGPRGSAAPAALAALLKEAWVGGNLEHPNVVPVHALVEVDGAPAVVMKRIEGTSLSAGLRAPAAGDPLESHLRVLVAVCNAVAYAHRRGVLHLDLKPDNVMLGRFGEVCVLDWGLAAGFGAEAPSWLPAAAEIRAVSGTPDYMAPEIAMGDGANISPRTDVYLLGAMLHEIVTGSAPHGGATLLERLEHAYRSAPFVYPAAVPAELAGILRQSMDRDPERRFPSAEALRDALEAFLAHRRGDEMLREAERRIDLLEAALAAGADELVVSRRFGGARFALREATEARPTAVGEQLRARLYGGMARRALDGGRLAIAESYLEQIGADRAERSEISEQLADLRRRAAAESARVHALEDLAHDEDLRLGSQFRRKVTVGFGLVFLAGNLTYAALERFAVLTMGYGPMMTQSLGVLVTVGAYALWRRGALFQNRANASVFSVAILTYFLLQGFWVAGLWLGIPFRSALALSGVFYLLAGGAVSVTINPRFAASPVVAALGLLAGAVRPDLAWWTLGISGGLALAVVGLSWRDEPSEAQP